MTYLCPWWLQRSCANTHQCLLKCIVKCIMSTTDAYTLIYHSETTLTHKVYILWDFHSHFGLYYRSIKLSNFWQCCVSKYGHLHLLLQATHSLLGNPWQSLGPRDTQPHMTKWSYEWTWALYIRNLERPTASPSKQGPPIHNTSQLNEKPNAMPLY